MSRGGFSDARARLLVAKIRNEIAVNGFAGAREEILRGNQVVMAALRDVRDERDQKRVEKTLEQINSSMSLSRSKRGSSVPMELKILLCSNRAFVARCLGKTKEALKILKPGLFMVLQSEDEDDETRQDLERSPVVELFLNTAAVLGASDRHLDALAAAQRALVMARWKLSENDSVENKNALAAAYLCVAAELEHLNEYSVAKGHFMHVVDFLGASADSESSGPNVGLRIQAQRAVDSLAAVAEYMCPPKEEKEEEEEEEEEEEFGPSMLCDGFRPFVGRVTMLPLPSRLESHIRDHRLLSSKHFRSSPPSASSIPRPRPSSTSSPQRHRPSTSSAPLKKSSPSSTSSPQRHRPSTSSAPLKKSTSPAKRPHTSQAASRRPQPLPSPMERKTDRAPRSRSRSSTRRPRTSKTTRPRTSTTTATSSKGRRPPRHSSPLMSKSPPRPSTTNPSTRTASTKLYDFKAPSWLKDPALVAHFSGQRQNPPKISKSTAPSETPLASTVRIKHK